jgi:hypothetical protein
MYEPYDPFNERDSRDAFRPNDRGFGGDRMGGPILSPQQQQRGLQLAPPIGGRGGAFFSGPLDEPPLAAPWDQPIPVARPLAATLAPSLTTFANELAASASRQPAPLSSSAAAKVFKYPTKAATPCRFFNTPKGCQFGDKCAFGHFREREDDDDLNSRPAKSRRRSLDEDEFGRARR